MGVATAAPSIVALRDNGIIDPMKSLHSSADHVTLPSGDIR